MSWVRAARGAVGWTLLAAALAVLVVTVVVPRVAGASSYVVLSGSMRPAIDPGDLVVVRPVAADEVGVGSVITYQLDSGRPETVTHRVVAVTTTAAGDRLFSTRGDANGAADPEPVRAVQVRGELWYVVPQAGRLAAVVPPTARRAAIWLLGCGLLGYAGVVLALGLRDRNRPRPDVRVPAHRADA